MRWNCPHCSIELFIDDNRIGNEWSFSRCYSCGGFSLVRKSNVNTIKIEQAPTPQSVLQPTPVLPAPEGAIAAIESKAQTRATAIPQQQQRSQKQAEILAKTSGLPASQPASPAAKPPSAFAGRKLPAPLPEKPAAAARTVAVTGRARKREVYALPAAIGIAGIVAIGSGLYLYQQGQELWENTRVELSSGGTPAAAASKIVNKDALHLVSKKNNLVADRISRSAMAPDRVADADAGMASDESGVETETLYVTGSEDSGSGEQESKNKNTRKSEQRKDRTTKERKPSSTRSMTVKLIRPDVNMRIGPGLGFPIIGKGDHTISYSVIDWRDEWFKVSPDTGPSEEAWVRNDFVRTVTE